VTDHDFQPVEVDGKTIPQCSRCGHRWYGKGEAKKPCVDTITVTIHGRAVVFERGPDSMDGCHMYINGATRMIFDPRDKDWKSDRVLYSKCWLKYQKVNGGNDGKAE